MKLRDLTAGDKFVFCALNCSGEVVEVYRGEFLRMYDADFAVVRLLDDDKEYKECADWDVDLIDEGEICK